MAEYSGRDKRLQYLFDAVENVQVDDMTGASASTDGAHGLVPAPLAGDEDKYLRGDGLWAKVQSGSEVSITPTLSSGTKIADFSINGTAGILFAPEGGGGGGLPGQGYTGSDLILRDVNGNISSVWYIDGQGNWVEYTKETGGGSGHVFGVLTPDYNISINNSFSISITNAQEG